MSNLQSPPGFRRRLTAAQRVGRVLLLVLVVVGAAGLFGGNGPFSGQRILIEGEGMVTLPRFVRDQTPFNLSAQRTSGSHAAWRLTLSNDLVSNLSIESISPAPRLSRWSAEGLELVFEPGTTRLTLRARPDAVGRIGGQLRMDDGAPVRIPLWAYP